MLKISDTIVIPEAELRLTAVRSRGPGGQNVNKVSSAVQLRFDAARSASLPDDVRERLLRLNDQRITDDGIINIKAQRSRSQEKNRSDALARLRDLILQATVEPKIRRKTRPGRKAKEKRLADKAHRSQLKQARGKVPDD